MDALRQRFGIWARKHPVIYAASTAASILLAILGLASIPSNIATWHRWLSPIRHVTITGEAARWGFVVLGVVAFLVLHFGPARATATSAPPQPVPPITPPSVRSTSLHAEAGNEDEEEQETSSSDHALAELLQRELNRATEIRDRLPNLMSSALYHVYGNRLPSGEADIAALEARVARLLAKRSLLRTRFESDPPQPLPPLAQFSNPPRIRIDHRIATLAGIIDELQS